MRNDTSKKIIFFSLLLTTCLCGTPCIFQQSFPDRRSIVNEIQPGKYGWQLYDEHEILEYPMKSPHTTIITLLLCCSLGAFADESQYFHTSQLFPASVQSPTISKKQIKRIIKNAIKGTPEYEKDLMGVRIFAGKGTLISK